MPPPRRRPFTGPRRACCLLLPMLSVQYNLPAMKNRKLKVRALQGCLGHATLKGCRLRRQKHVTDLPTLPPVTAADGPGRGCGCGGRRCHPTCRRGAAVLEGSRLKGHILSAATPAAFPCCFHCNFCMRGSGMALMTRRWPMPSSKRCNERSGCVSLHFSCLLTV
jgi:hypothetical protein